MIIYFQWIQDKKKCFKLLGNPFLRKLLKGIMGQYLLMAKLGQEKLLQFSEKMGNLKIKA